MLKAAQVAKLTSTSQNISEQERTIANLVFEIEPTVWSQIATFWVYTCTLQNISESEVLEFILQSFEEN